MIPIAMALLTGPLRAQAGRPKLDRAADHNDWQAYYQHGVAVLQERPNEALAAVELAHRLDPGRAEPLFASWVADWLSNANRFADYLADPGAALKRPGPAEAKENRRQAFLRNPLTHQGRRRGGLRPGVRRKPGFWPARWARSTVKTSGGDLKGAVDELRQAIELESGEGWLHAEYADAIAQADAAIRLSPDYARPYLTLATAALQVADTARAVGGLRGYLARGPRGAETARARTLPTTLTDSTTTH